MRRTAALLAVAVLVAGCAGGPILANPPAQRPAATPAPRPSTTPLPDPLPVELPRDDAAHDRLTEWWYYTGHLRDETSGRWGFEFVVFRAQRGSFPVTWASHLAVTDETGDRFTYAQRSEIGAQVDRATEPGVFHLAIAGADLARPETLGRAAWEMGGSGGNDRLQASADAAETSGDRRAIGIDVVLSSTRPPMLHDTDGWIDFGPAGSSYYYSRTRLRVIGGTLAVDGEPRSVTGSAWFDHQWGDFIAVGGGGWDWFAVNLDDGTDVTLSLVRDAEGGYPLVYGTLQRADGSTRHLPADAFRVDVTRRWQSPSTGADYPAGWRIAIPDEGYTIELVPTVADQELDTTATTGVVYWEGSQRVTATRHGEPLGGEAYVELTGYGRSPVPEP
jgi:predicted secreted hydrolase